MSVSLSLRNTVRATLFVSLLFGALPVRAIEVAASPLLAIDRHRTDVVDRIVGQWGGALTRANAGIDGDQLREMLLAMRSDQLLAASLAGTLDGLRNVIASALVSESTVASPLVRPRALGNADEDLVYVPVTPCRLVETRGTFPAVYQGGGAFAPNEVRSYTLEGGNGVCLTQLPASVSPSAVQMQVYGIPTTSGSGDIEILPQGGAFGSSASLVYLGNNAFTSSAVTSLANLANKQISVQVRGGGAHVAIDVVGYFRAPQGGYVSSITAGAGLTGGTITSTGTIAVDTNAIQSRVTGTCAAGSSIRTINSNGTVVCETDDVGTGTVTSVATGTGLTGGPITTSGTVSIAPGGVTPTELASSAVTAPKIAANAVTTAAIADANVTKSKLSATGGISGQVLTTNGSGLVWETVPSLVSLGGPIAPIAGSSVSFVFVASPVTVTVPAGEIRRVTVTASAALGLASGGAIGIQVDICYQPSGGSVSSFHQNWLNVAVTTNRTSYAVADTASFGAGTYNVGLCVKNSTITAINNNDYAIGWVMVTR